MKLSKNTNISVVGLGYVGLQLSIALSKKYSTTGFDINKARINELNIGEDKSLEVSKEKLRNAKEIIFTHDLKSIANCSVYIITVPTPVDNNNKPDMGPLISASEMIGKLISSGDIIIYESTVYPGATEEICVPILEECSNLKYNVDFSCGYSPERINPGDKKKYIN